MSNATLTGKSPIAAANAGLATIRRKTRSKIHRLGKRGPKVK